MTTSALDIPAFLRRTDQNGKTTGVHVKKFPPAVAKGAYKSTSEAKAKIGEKPATSKPAPEKDTAEKLSTLKARKGKDLAAVAPKAVSKISAAKKPAKVSKPHKATAEEFTVNKMVFRGKNALLLKLVSRKDGKAKGATMRELLKATGWAACSSTLGKLCRQSGLKLQRDEGEGDTRRFWV